MLQGSSVRPTGSELPTPSRRTLAADQSVCADRCPLGFARSETAALRGHRSAQGGLVAVCACRQRRLKEMGSPEPSPTIAGQARGCPCPRASYGRERRLEAEAKRTCREPRPGGPRRTSSERARVSPKPGWACEHQTIIHAHHDRSRSPRPTRGPGRRCRGRRRRSRRRAARETQGQAGRRPPAGRRAASPAGGSSACS
jgi:hypothetical protein